jgi:intracellular multiplication protein IcmC
VANDLPAFWNLLIAFASLTGFVLCGYGLYRAVEEQKRGESMMGAAGIFMVGIGLVNFIYFVNSATMTIGFSTGNLSTFSYTASSSSGTPGSSVPSFAFVILKFFGWLAAFRALLLWSESARSGSPPGTVWRGTTHFVAGIFLININQFLGTMGNYMGG